MDLTIDYKYCTVLKTEYNGNSFEGYIISQVWNKQFIKDQGTLDRPIILLIIDFMLLYL